MLDVEQISIEALYLAGQLVRPGVYREVESRREIELNAEDFLPASLDGRVAAYVLIDPVRQKKAAQQAAN